MHITSIQSNLSTLSADVVAFLSKLKSLDLGPIAYKLLYPDEGNGWTKEEITRAITHYKIFLLLVFLHPGRPIIPTKEIDHVWHNHILDTSKYAQDCEFLFGYFLHHYPYGGTRNGAEQQQLETDFLQIQQFLQQYFDLSIPEYNLLQPSGCDIVASNGSLQLSGCNIMVEHPLSNNYSGCNVPSYSRKKRPTIPLDLDPFQRLDLELV